MKTRIMCMVALGALLTACGGSSSDGSKFKDPNAVDFTYGDKASTEATPYDDAAGIGADAGGAATQEPSGDMMGDLMNSFMLAGGPLVANSMIFDGIDIGVFTSSPVLQDPRLGILRGSAAELVGADPVDPSLKAAVNCQVALDTNGLVIDHCQASVDYAQDLQSIAADASLSGKLLRATDAMKWGFKLSVGLDTVDDTYSMGADLYGEMKGQLAADTTAFTLKGYSRVSYSVELRQADTAAPAEDGTLAGAVSDQADVDLTYDPTEKCVNGGTITLKRVWTTLLAGTGAWDTTGKTFADESAQITYTPPVAPALCSTEAEYAVGAVSP